MLLITCEHGGNEVPAEYAALFEGAEAVLASHRGWDPGALPVAQRLAAALAAPLLHSTTTRLLVELNRSPGHPQKMSEFTASLSETARAELLARYDAPYRESLDAMVGALVAAGRSVLHVSVHSFVDTLDGAARELDMGLLFDPARAREAAFCERWRERLDAAAPDARTAFNEPYRGMDDGLTTWLRGRHGDDRYAGIEVELRQGWVKDAVGQGRVADLLASTLSADAAFAN